MCTRCFKEYHVHGQQSHRKIRYQGGVTWPNFYWWSQKKLLKLCINKHNIHSWTNSEMEYGTSDLGKPGEKIRVDQEKCEVPKKETSQHSLSSTQLFNTVTSSRIAAGLACLGAAGCLMGCGLGYRSIRQSIADSVRLSMWAALHLNLCRAFPEAYAWVSLHLCELCGDVAPGSCLRAWALWEGTQRQPTSYQSWTCPVENFPFLTLGRD